MALTNEEIKVRTNLYHREKTVREAVCKVITVVNAAAQTCSCLLSYSNGNEVFAEVSYSKHSRDKGRQAAKDAALHKLRRVLATKRII